MGKATPYLAALLVLLAFPVPGTQAQTLTILHSFTLSDGAYPVAGLIMDKEGNLYGATGHGGIELVPYGYGTVFKLDTTGQESVLHSFTFTPDGAGPVASLIMDKSGNLYGTTQGGGSSGYGTVFKLDTTGQQTVLHSFTYSDGAYPYAGLIMDKEGNLYGTTQYGGSTTGFDGAVFKLDTTGQQTVLYSFTYTDGSNPFASLIMDKEGNLYGTTQGGGSSGYGTVFKLDTTGQQTVLYSFTFSPDGAYPYAGLIMDKRGNLYGTTYRGGASDYGTVFKLDRTGKESVLHSFTYSDGEHPFAGLIIDREGNLYGTTQEGGSSGYGTIFKVSP